MEKDSNSESVTVGLALLTTLNRPFLLTHLIQHWQVSSAYVRCDFGGPFSMGRNLFSFLFFSLYSHLHPHAYKLFFIVI